MIKTSQYNYVFFYARRFFGFAPLFLIIPAIFIGILMLLPSLYLIIRAFEANEHILFNFIFRYRTLQLLINTLSLTFCVCLISTLMALPLAWLVTHSDLGAKKLISFFSILPLAVPGYVMAFALIGLGGYYGFFYQNFGIRFTRPEGLWGAAFALALYIFPYSFLHLRSALNNIDPVLYETARSFGYPQRDIFRKITLPHLLPSLIAGWWITGLYTLGDFGAVSLMRFDVFSSAIYNQYANGFERHYAAWYSLILLGICCLFFIISNIFKPKGHLARTGTGTRRPIEPIPLGYYKLFAWLFIIFVLGASLGLPATVIIFWFMKKINHINQWNIIWDTAINTALLAIPSAFIAVLFAFPATLLSIRYHSRFNNFLDRLVYFCYAIPPLPFALATAFFTLRLFPALYQTLLLLMIAYGLSFAALANGPMKTTLLQNGQRYEEAARTFGYSQIATILKVTLPLLYKSMLSGGILTFLVIVKELPLAILLSPTGFRTLSMNIFHYTEEGMLVEAAPYALLMILFSGFFVGLSILYGDRHSS